MTSSMRGKSHTRLRRAVDESGKRDLPHIDGRTVRVLLVEDNETLATGIQAALADDPRQKFETIHVKTLADAMRALEGKLIDVAIVDLGLPDACDMEAPRTIREFDADLPIVVLTGAVDDRLVVGSARVGVQDYIFKKNLSQDLLLHTLRFAIVRNRMLLDIKGQALKDELTGLYNRRGFFAVGERQLLMVKPQERPALLFYVDIDGMKTCNDEHGHEHGDALLVRTAKILRKTFRESDVLSRLGGDEFAVLAVDAGLESVESLLTRIEANRQQGEPPAGHSCPVDLSIGYAGSSVAAERSLDELMSEADRMMFANKRDRRDKRTSHVARE